MTKILLFYIAIVLISCRNQTKDVEVKIVENNRELILTSDRDKTGMTLYIPVEIEITNNTDWPVTDIFFLIEDCNSQYKYFPRFTTKKSKFDFDYVNMDTILPNQRIKLTVYAMKGIHPKNPDINFDEFKSEYDFIKKRATEKNNYINDTVKYKDMESLKLKHGNYYLDLSTKCEMLDVEILTMDENRSRYNKSLKVNLQ